MRPVEPGGTRITPQRRIERPQPQGVSIKDLQTQAKSGLYVDSFEPSTRKLLKQVDAAGNKDKRISAQEIQAYQQRLMEKVQTLASKPNATKKDLADAQQAFKDFQALTPIAQFTSQAQGYADTLATIASKVDTVVQDRETGKLIGNHDGRVTQNEVSAFIEEMGQRAAKSPNSTEGYEASQLKMGGEMLLEVLRLKAQQPTQP